MSEIRAIVASPAAAAAVAKRLEQYERHGHCPTRDRERPLDRLVREADRRLRDALDRLGPEGGDLDYALKKIEIATACLLAAHDLLSWALGQRAEGATNG